MVLELDLSRRFRWVPALGVGQICVFIQKFTIWCPSHCTPHGQRDCRAVDRAGTNPLGQGPCQVPAAEKSRVGQWASLDGSPERENKLCQSRVNIEVRLGDPSSFTILPSVPIFISPLLCAGPCACFCNRDIFQFQFFLIVSFYHQIKHIFDKQERKAFSHKFLRCNMKWGGVRKWEKLLLYFHFNNF